jgi:hypothetical protein
MVRLQILRFWCEKRMLPCQRIQREVATMPYANNHGIRLHYQVEGAGPPLVLQHGFSDSLESWYEMGYVKPLQQTTGSSSSTHEAREPATNPTTPPPIRCSTMRQTWWLCSMP